MEPNPLPHPRPVHNIVSPRLILRTPTAADTDAYYKILSTPENFPFDELDADMTPDKVLAKINRISLRTAEGLGALLVIALRATDELIGYGGFNCFQHLDPAAFLGPGAGHTEEPDADAAQDEATSTLPIEKQYLADIGIMLDHSQWRKGFGLEALSAQIEYARVELGCGLFRIETDLANEPWRALMRTAGLGPYESKHKATYDKNLDVWVWKFDASQWEQSKEALKAAGRWPL